MLMICAFVYGFLDGTLNTQLIAMIGVIFPSERDSAGAFVVWNLVQFRVILKNIPNFFSNDSQNKKNQKKKFLEKFSKKKIQKQQKTLEKCLFASLGLIYSQYLALHSQTFINISVMILSLGTLLKLDLLMIRKCEHKDVVKNLTE